jgi:hypothetical protein
MFRRRSRRRRRHVPARRPASVVGAVLTALVLKALDLKD